MQAWPGRMTRTLGANMTDSKKPRRGLSSASYVWMHNNIVRCCVVVLELDSDLKKLRVWGSWTDAWATNRSTGQKDVRSAIQQLGYMQTAASTSTMAAAASTSTMAAFEAPSYTATLPLQCRLSQQLWGPWPATQGGHSGRRMGRCSRCHLCCSKRELMFTYSASEVTSHCP